MLPPELYEQLINRQRDDALREVENLVACPKPDCDYRVIVDDPAVTKVLYCPKCRHPTCLLCKKDWKDHVGLRCNQVEDDSATAARRKIEEDMTAAMMRECHKCKVT